MKLSIKTSNPQNQQKTCIIIGIYESGDLTPAAKELDKATQGLITKLVKQGAIQGKMGQCLPLFHPANSEFEQILIIGCGKPKSLSPAGDRKSTRLNSSH